MDFKLTSKNRFSYHDNDGKDRNYKSYYLNDILILKQKIPFDKNWEVGFDRITTIFDEYILNGRLYQKRNKRCSNGLGYGTTKTREVSFPLSKKVMNQFNISKDVKIFISK
jgi:hypothetical protein